MQQSRLQNFRNKAKLTLSLPETKLKTKSPQQIPDKEASTKSSVSSKSSSSESLVKASFHQKYAVEETLGQGAHGVVKACTLKEKNQKYAVKIMKLNDEISLMYRKNFRTMKCLNHENILKYRSLYLDNAKQTSFLVMEYLPYPTLKGLKLTDEDELILIVEEILSAIIYMHKKNIAHRDLKPDNILFSREQKKVKLIDFGICKKMTMRGEKSEMVTSTGTIAYKAPQMFQGSGYDQKVDLWALGVILYELVTGRNPFYSAYTDDTIKNIHLMQVNYNDECWNQYDKLLKDLISHLLKRKPSERLSAQEAVKHLYFKNDIFNIQKKSYRETNCSNKEQSQHRREVQTIWKPNSNKIEQGKEKAFLSQKNMQLLVPFYDSEQEQGIY